MARRPERTAARQPIFRVLGSPSVAHEGALQPIPAGHHAMIFLFLADNIGKPVSTHVLVDLLYPDGDHPRKPKQQVQRCISRLRAITGRDIELDLLSESYCLEGNDDEVDAHLVAEQANRAADLYNSGHYRDAIAEAESALTPWRSKVCPAYFRSDATTVLVKQLMGHRDLASRTLVESHLAVGEADDALRFLEMHLLRNGRHHGHHESEREDLWIRLIELRHREGNPRKVTQAITRMRVQYAEIDAPLPGWVDELEAETAVAPVSLTALPLPVASPEAHKSFEIRRSLPPEARRVLRHLDPLDHAGRNFTTLLESVERSPGFHLYFVSGVSAAGKDSIVMTANKYARGRARFDILRKFTSRPRRLNEPVYVASLDELSFYDRLDKGKLIWAYIKRNTYYGFDADQVRQAIYDGTKLVAIFTEIDAVPLIVDAMNEFGLPTTAIWITADEITVQQRMSTRGFDDEEVKERVMSAGNDLDIIRDRSTFEDEYAFIEHTNSHDQDNARRAFLNIVSR